VRFWEPGLLGMITPKTVLKKPITDWSKGYLTPSPCAAIWKEQVRNCLLIGLVASLAKVSSLSELQKMPVYNMAVGFGANYSNFSFGL